jgi:hypothetical protein
MQGFQPPLRYIFVGKLPTARDNEAAAGVVRAAKEILGWKGRFTNPLDHLRPALFAVSGFLFRRTVLKLFLASDAERRPRHRLKPRDRYSFSALGTQKTEVIVVRWLPV